MAGKGIGKSNVLKVNIGWAALIAGGIGAFILARNSVLEKRQAAIRTKKRVIEDVEREAVGETNLLGMRELINNVHLLKLTYTNCLGI